MVDVDWALHSLIIQIKIKYGVFPIQSYTVNYCVIHNTIIFSLCVSSYKCGTAREEFYLEEPNC